MHLRTNNKGKKGDKAFSYDGDAASIRTFVNFATKIHMYNKRYILRNAIQPTFDQNAGTAEFIDFLSSTPSAVSVSFNIEIQVIANNIVIVANVTRE